ncbi:MAG: hypothetical protein ABJP79_18755 [Tateyamaria sp.]|uniref:hypothetical protein n=1 Tax=Tateyamaria sp. TaxID=1929288 RepID=UPI00329C46D5
MKEELLYFFYGRAEYRGLDLKASDLEAERPMCFVLGEIDAGSILSTFPFDTGAFQIEGGIKENFFPHIEDVFALSMGGEITDCQKLVQCFYGNNDKFRNNDPEKLDFDPFLELEVGSYIQLINKRGIDTLDGRSSTPEIVALENISLDEVEYVIVHIENDSSPFFKQKCKEHRIEPIYFHTKTPLRPGEYISVIQDRFDSL